MRFIRFISLPYLLLRSLTAGTALIAGLIQTFVFARVVSPDMFSQFILVATLGFSLWMFDLGVAKVLFVQLRKWFLSGREGDEVPTHATAVVALYFTLVVVCTILCFGFMALRPQMSLQHAGEFALFFFFTAITLVWFAIRNISVAVDAFIRFEILDALRRIGHMAVMLSMLAGVPMLQAMIAGIAIWAVIIGAALAGLLRRRALVPRLSGLPRDFVTFFRGSRAEILRTGTYALNEHFLYNFPYFFVLYAFGLGAPTIILDTTFKVFRGATVVFSAGCDIAVPRQTRAYKEGDQNGLIQATLVSAALCSVPAFAISAILIFAADKAFPALLGSSAAMPHATTPILIVLIFANLIQTVSNFVLVHTGYFKEIARLATVMTVAMIGMIAIALFAQVDIIGFFELYAAVYCVGASLYAWLAIRGPIRDAGADAAANPALAGAATALPRK